MKNGVAASYQDNSAHGEDAFVIRELGESSSLDAVLDGVTHCEGAYAGSFTAQVVKDASIESLEDLLAALEQASNTLFQSGGGTNLLTTVSAALKLGAELHVINAGDSPVYLIRGGEPRELTTIVKASSFASVVTGALGQQEKFAYQYRKVTLEHGDRIVLATDGLTNNMSPAELAEILQQAVSSQQAVSAIGDLVTKKRRQERGRTYGTFREDDRTAIVRFFD